MNTLSIHKNKQAKKEEKEVGEELINPPLSPEEIEDKRKSKHYEMIFTYVSTGLSNRELGNMFDISEAHIRHMKNTSLWKNEEELLRASVRRDNQVKIDLLVPTAITTIDEVMQDESASSTAKVNAATKALEIAEYGKTRDKGEDKGGRNVTLNLTRPGWDKGEGEGGDTINIQVNID